MNDTTNLNNMLGELVNRAVKKAVDDLIRERVEAAVRAALTPPDPCQYTVASIPIGGSALDVVGPEGTAIAKRQEDLPVRHGRRRRTGLFLREPPGVARRSITKGNALMMRGSIDPTNTKLTYRKRTLLHNLAVAIWEALSPDGHFISGRATRDDIGKFLIATFPGENPTTIISSISILQRSGILTVVPDEFLSGGSA